MRLPGRAYLPPNPDDNQRRCWVLYGDPYDDIQCRLFNGHEGTHQFGWPDPPVAAPAPRCTYALGVDRYWCVVHEARWPEGKRVCAALEEML